MLADPLRRFSSRVDAYARYRPSYPPGIFSFLRSECDLNAHSQVADIGSGTGILTHLLLDLGCEVAAVEPNAEMRAAAEAQLSSQKRFHSVNGKAEATTLPDHSYDLVTAAQAFHWFDADLARAEFARILRPPRWVALVWNKRIMDGHPFLEGYEALLQQFGTDYKEVGHRDLDGRAGKTFFQHSHWKKAIFENRQEFDFEGLQGRLDSSSYAPAPGTPEHIELVGRLRDLFLNHAVDGRVSFLYETSVFAGSLAPR